MEFHEDMWNGFQVRVDMILWQTEKKTGLVSHPLAEAGMKNHAVGTH